MTPDEKFAVARQGMVQNQLMRRGIHDAEVLRSMLEVPRHLFVPEKMVKYAYEDGPLLIGEGQTISQPYIVALMSSLAHCTPNARVLDIGTGSGYAAAIFSHYVKEVFTIERIESLALKAQKLFQTLGYSNIHVKVGDGTLGLLEAAPFDAIVVTAGAPAVPEHLLEQLKVGGRLVIPVGDSGLQRLMRITRGEGEGEFVEEMMEAVRFVPLIGEDGWHDFRS